MNRSSRSRPMPETVPSEERRSLFGVGLAGAAMAATASWLAGCGRGHEQASDTQATPVTGTGDAGDTGSSDAPLPDGHALQLSAASPQALRPFANATLVLDRVGRRSQPIDTRFAGLSYEKNKLVQPLFTPANAAQVGLLRRLGPGVVRIGANQVDRSSWNGVVPGLTAIRPPQIDALADFLAVTGWQVIYGINLANNTPANAAAEAQYVASRLGSSLLCFEIGNEPELYATWGFRPSTWAYADFLKEWRDMRGAIAAAVPGALIAGPAGSHKIRELTVPFASDQGGAAAMLTQHYYRANGQDPTSTIELLLSPDPTLDGKLAMLTTAATSASMPLGWRFGECNSFYNAGRPGVSNTFGTALWAIDFMFRCALGGCAGVNFHTGGNTASYTAITDRSGIIEEARPVYYGLLLFSQAARGRAVPGVVTAAQGLDVGGYGVLRNDGGINVVLLNRSATAQATVVVKMGQASGPMRQTLLTCAGGLSSTTGVTLAGSSVAPDGTWRPVATEPIGVDDAGETVVAVPAASALLLQSA